MLAPPCVSYSYSSADRAVGWTCGLAQHIQVTNLWCWLVSLSRSHRRAKTPWKCEKGEEKIENTQILFKLQCLYKLHLQMLMKPSFWLAGRLFDMTANCRNWGYQGQGNIMTHLCIPQNLFSFPLSVLIFIWQILKQTGYFIQTGTDS